MVLDSIKILLFEDYSGDALIFQEYLREENLDQFEIDHVKNLRAGLERLVQARPDIILLDLGLPDSQGLETFTQVHAQVPNIPIVVLTGFNDASLAIQAVKAGAQDYLVKGDVNGGILVRAIHYAIERKKTQEKLKKLEWDYRQLSENSPDLIARFDAQVRHLYVNPAAAKAGMLSANEYIGLTISETGVPEPLATKWEQRIREVFSSGKKSTITDTFPTPEGLRTFNTQLVPEFGPDGSIVSVLSTARDISKLAQTEKSLRESNDFNTMLLQTIPFGMIIVNDSGQLLFMSPLFEKILGQNELGVRCWEVFRDDKKQCPDCPLKQNIEKGVTKIIETSGMLGGRYFEVTHTGIIYKGKKAILEVFHDISQRKQAEVKIHRYNEQLAAVGDIGRILAASLDLEQIYHQLGQAIHRLLPDIATIFISRFDPKQQLISAIFGMQDGEQINVAELPAIPLSPSGQGTQSQVIRTGKPLIVPDLQKKISGRPAVRVGAEGPDTQSAVYVPMVSKNEVLGVIQLQSYTPARFTKNDVKLLSLVGNTATVAIQNAELFKKTQSELALRMQAEDEIRRRLSELEILYASSQVIGQSLQPKEIAKQLLDVLSERLNWHHAALRMYNTRSDTLELLAFHQPGLENEADRLAAEEYFNSMVSRPGDGLAGWAFQHGQPVYCPNVTKDQRYRVVWPGIHSGMYVPLKVGESTIGVLSIESEQAGAFTETDEWLFTTLASQAASAFENARLFEETSRRLSQLQTLHKIDIAINNNLDLGLTFDVFLEQGMSQLSVDAMDILQFNPNTQTLEYAAGRGFHTDALKHTRLRLGEGYAGLAGLEQKLIFITELQNKKTDFLRSPSFSSEGFESYYCVPLIAKGNLMGVLETFQRYPFEANHEWKDFLQTLAGQLAIAIDNATLFINLQDSITQLNQAYDATIEGWSRAMDLRDHETEGHTQRVAKLSFEIAQALGMDENKILHLRRGALLHDIGKLGVPDHILMKSGELTEEEWVLMRKHPVFAYEMLQPIHYLRDSINIPYCHHEKWDGTGYPRGLKGEQIPIEARIFAVVDVWDALTSDRPYRKAWSREKALSHIQEQAGKHFDPEIVPVFLGMEASFEK